MGFEEKGQARKRGQEKENPSLSVWVAMHQEGLLLHPPWERRSWTRAEEKKSAGQATADKEEVSAVIMSDMIKI